MFMLSVMSLVAFETLIVCQCSANSWQLSTRIFVTVHRIAVVSNCRRLQLFLGVQTTLFPLNFRIKLLLAFLVSSASTIWPNVSVGNTYSLYSVSNVTPLSVGRNDDNWTDVRLDIL
jgi:hypothetical protein